MGGRGSPVNPLNPALINTQGNCIAVYSTWRENTLTPHDTNTTLTTVAHDNFINTTTSLAGIGTIMAHCWIYRKRRLLWIDEDRARQIIQPTRASTYIHTQGMGHLLKTKWGGGRPLTFYPPLPILPFMSPSQLPDIHTCTKERGSMMTETSTNTCA